MGALLDTCAVIVDRIIASKDVYVLISEFCKCYLIWQNGFCRSD